MSNSAFDSTDPLYCDACGGECVCGAKLRTRKPRKKKFVRYMGPLTPDQRYGLAKQAQTHLFSAILYADKAGLPLIAKRLKACTKSMQGAVNNRERFAQEAAQK